MHELQAGQRQIRADCSALQVAGPSLEMRVQVVENLVTELKCFQVVAERHMATVDCQLTEKVDYQEVKAINIQAKRAVDQLGDELRSELASEQLVLCLQKEQSELHERLETMETRLTTKMDKSETARFESILVQIHEFRPIASQLSSQVKSVLMLQEQMERMVLQLETDHKECVTQLQHLRHNASKMQHRLDRVDDRHRQIIAPQMLRLDAKTKLLHQAVEDIKTTAVSSETALSTLSAKFQSSFSMLSTQLQQQYRHIKDALMEKVPRHEVETQLAGLSRQVATKALDLEHKALALSVKTLEERCEKLQNHVELSTRFLDWFASRGEAYEHNLNLVEAQLSRLAQTSHPLSREPFGERIRFPQSP